MSSEKKYSKLKAAGNAFLALAIAATGYFIFYFIPHAVIQDIRPYARTLSEMLRVTEYLPLIIPLGILVVTIVFYLRQTGNKAQQTLIWVAVVMVSASCIGTILYVASYETFMAARIVYRGNCTVIRFGVEGDGEYRRIYADFSCENNPQHLLRSSDPDVVLRAMRHSGPLPYKISASQHPSLP